MKFRIFSTVLILGVIFVIGYVHYISPRIAKIERAVLDAKENAEKAEEERIAKLPNHIQSLVGVKGVCVLIDSLPERAKYTGLTKEQLKTDVELMLRLAGIKVNSQEEMLASKDGAKLYVSVNTDSQNDNSHYSVRVSLSGFAVITFGEGSHGKIPDGGNSNIRASYRRGGGSNGRDFQQGIRQVVKELVDMFLNDYLIANPKK